MSSLYYKYWGKADKNDSEKYYHLLVYHSLDVAAVGSVWLSKNKFFVESISSELRLSVKAFCEWFLFFLSLHDLGKFSVRFQNLIAELLRKLQGIESDLKYDGEKLRHDQLGWELYYKYLLAKFHDDCFKETDATNFANFINVFAFCFLGHHGVPPQLDSSPGVDLFSVSEIEAASAFFQEVKRLFLSNESIDEIKKIIVLPRRERRTILDHFKKFSWHIAGLITICDWIGSGKTFKYYKDENDLKTYYENAIRVAEEAVIKAEVIGSKVSSISGFAHLFPDYVNTSTPLQRICNVIEIPEGPQLWILEDVTGSGKTEAAMTLVSRILSSGGGEGCFIALPTMATSNAMYERMASVYYLLFDQKEKPSLVLSHGSRHLSETFRNSYRDTYVNLPNDTDENDEERREGDVHCSQWLADSSKKSLLADCGVGTVDQILLGGLPVRYQDLRIFGMRRKVIVIDEVHAYDAYMLRLLENILSYQASIGGSVILLSATLPQKVRKRLADSFAKGLGIEQVSLENRDFPLITVVSKKAVSEIHSETRKELNRSVKVEFLYDIESIENLITEKTSSGNCVCWIRNSVTDVIESYNSLSGKIDPEKLDIFHSRFALRDRLNIEKKVIDHFGKNSDSIKRQGRVLIATQVVEQSLDLDFDILISDLAPIDLLIQRCGRLHRHHRDAKGDRLANGAVSDRPDPIFYIYSPPAMENPTASWYKEVFPRGAAVYKDTAILWRTFRALKKEGEIRMPEKGRELIEAVYGENPEEIPSVFTTAEDESWAELMSKKELANFYMLDFNSGYSVASSRKWDVDERVQSRIGEPQNTIYLCKMVDGQIKPFYDNEEYPWDQSSLKLLKSKLVEVDYPEEAKGYISELQKQLRFKYDTLFIVLGDELKANGHDAIGRTVKIIYDKNIGLMVIIEK
jgi:CRISPR-associated endonuclease/helicase Cas3